MKFGTLITFSNSLRTFCRIRPLRRLVAFHLPFQIKCQDRSCIITRTAKTDVFVCMARDRSITLWTNGGGSGFGSKWIIRLKGFGGKGRRICDSQVIDWVSRRMEVLMNLVFLKCYEKAFLLYKVRPSFYFQKKAPPHHHEQYRERIRVRKPKSEAASRLYEQQRKWVDWF